ncbi:MAG: DUF928 domain-containing protein, partial [Xenococcus sp. (in: cyanobacteria)]
MSLFLQVVRGFVLSSTLITAIVWNLSLAVAERPKPPDTGTPSGNTTPGTTRPETACPKTSKPLTAIVANQGQDFTLEEYPTFLFYIPYTPQQISEIEFLILNETQTKTIYHSSIKLNDRPGIIKLKLPPETLNSLQVNNTYPWRFNLDCQPDNTIAPDLVLKGWIRRISLNSEVENQLKLAKSQEYLVYQNHSIWYDAIANLAELYFNNPEDKEITEAWTDTLQLL